MENGLSKFWKNYRRRLVPWLASNVKDTSRREVAAASDKIVPDDKLKTVIIKITSCLDEALKVSSSANDEELMSEIIGYSVKRCKSHIQGAGTGVIMSAGSAQRGDLVSLYPGTLYRRFEPLFLPSIGNRFILRCKDGIHVDGNDGLLSKSIFRSCANRDSFGKYRAADTSWMTEKPTVPWNIGQYVNNSTKEYPANVAYQECDIEEFPPALDYLLPNIWYSGSRGRLLRTVALIATREIHEGDEILSNYVTFVHDS